MLLLKQSTAATVKIGPFIDDTDGKTAETGLTISQADVRLSKNGANIAQKNESSAATHDELGIYDCSLDATDTGTLGRLQLWVHESGALPVWHEFMVVPANVYDSLIGGTDTLEVDVKAVSGDTTAADNLEADYDGTGYNKSNSEIGTAAALTGHTPQTGDSYVRIGANGGGLSAVPWNAAWDAEVQSECTDALNAYDPPTHAEVVTEVNDLQSEHSAMNANISSILADTNELQGDWTNGGRLDNLLDSILADTAEIGAAGAGLTAVPWNASWDAEVQSEVQDAIEANHLDHLLAANYDPAGKPGVATALLNELIENDGGVSRFTSNALEQAPSAGTNPNVLVDTTVSSVTSQTVFVLSGGSDQDDAYNDQAIVLYDATNSDYPSVRKVSDYTGSTKTITIDSAPDFTLAAGDGVKIFVTAPGTTAPTAAEVADAVLNEALSEHTNAGTLGKAVADIESDVFDILSDTAEIGAAGAGLTAVPWNSNWDAEVQSEVTDALNAYDPPTHAELVTEVNDLQSEHSVMNSNISNILSDTNELQNDWTNGGRLDNLLDSILTDTAEIGAAGAGLSNIPWNNAWDAEVESEVDDALGAGGADLTAIPWNSAWDAEVQSEVQDAIEANHLDHLLAADYDPASKPGTATALLNELVENDGGVSRFTANALEQSPSAGTNPNVLLDTTIATVTSQTELVLTAGSNDDDAYNDQAVVIYDGSDNDYPSVRKITDYVGSTKTITIDSGADFTAAMGDGIKIFVTAPGTTAPTAAQVADQVWEEALTDHSSTSGSTAEALSQIPGANKGAIEYTYTIDDGSNPIDGVEVWISTDSAGTNIIWYGTTDALGVARASDNEKPWLDAGTYYGWCQKAGYTFSNPDTLTVS